MGYETESEDNRKVGLYNGLAAIDLNFHDIDEKTGFYYKWLKQNGDIKDKIVLTNNENIQKALNNPPETGSAWLMDAAKEARKIICEVFLGEMPNQTIELWKEMIFSEPLMVKAFLRNNPKASKMQNLWTAFLFDWNKVYLRNSIVLERPEPSVSSITGEEKEKLYRAILSCRSY